jgi:hypothetical protein
VEQDRVIRYVGFGWAVLFTLTAGLFTAGYALDDPGGWRGVTLVAAWLVPLGVLTVIAAEWPRKGGRVLTAAVAIAVLLEVSALIAGTGRADLEEGSGPLRAVSAFALATPLAVLGLRRPVAAARLLLILGIATVVLSFTRGAGSAPMGAAGVGVVVTGLLYLLSNRSRRHGRPPVTEPPPAAREVSQPR